MVLLCGCYQSAWVLVSEHKNVLILHQFPRSLLQSSFFMEVARLRKFLTCCPKSLMSLRTFNLVIVLGGDTALTMAEPPISREPSWTYLEQPLSVSGRNTSTEKGLCWPMASEDSVHGHSDRTSQRQEYMVENCSPWKMGSRNVHPQLLGFCCDWRAKEYYKDYTTQQTSCNRLIDGGEG